MFNRFKHSKPKRRRYQLSHFDYNLFVKLKVYAIANQMTMWKSIEHLIVRGLQYESRFPHIRKTSAKPYDVTITLTNTETNND